MKNSLLGLCFALFSTVFLTRPMYAADAVFIGGASGTFNNPARWQDGYVPQAGDTAILLPLNDSNLQIPEGFDVTLSSILLNTNDANRYVAFDYATNTLVAPALIAVSNGTLAIRSSVLAGSDGLTFVSQKGTLDLRIKNLFTGPVSVQGGLLLLGFDESLGPVPGTFDPSAITLDGGMLGNFATTLTLAPTRGIITGAKGGYFSARTDPDSPLTPSLSIASPITGEGSVTIVRQASGVMFSNPDNDYAGETIFGAVTPVGYSTSADMGFSSLTLGADEVIPDTSCLVFPNGHDGLLDLNGHEETVKGIVATNSVFAVANSDPDNAGILHTPIPDAAINASIGAGATLDLTGAGTARFNDTAHAAYLSSAGTLALSEGVLALSDPARLGAVTLALNGGDLEFETYQPGLAESRFSVEGRVDTNALDGAFMGVFPVPRWANTKTSHANAFGAKTQYLYEGEWYVPANATYSFGKGFDDSACLVIDGQMIIYDYTFYSIVVKKDVYLTAGWHTIQLYVSNYINDIGPLTEHGFVSGILYDPANGGITNGLGLVENAYPFVDPGDGSVLRTLAPSATVTARARLEINSDATFDRSAASGTALAWAGDVVSAPGATLTVTGGSEPFTVGSPDRSAIFDAAVSDDNGVRFQDKVWVKTMPATLVYGANTELAAGVPGILGTGAQTLPDYSLRIPSSDALGDPSIAPVTVNTGRTLTFDSTTELNSWLIDDPDRAFTASNAVILAGGTLAFDGAGTVTLETPVSGSGNLIQAGSGIAILAHPSTFAGAVTVTNGTLKVLDDAALGNAANPVSLTGGTLDLSASDITSFSRDLALSSGSDVLFPITPLTLAGVLSGTLTKIGPGSLTLAGNAPNSTFDLYVSEGAVTLANTPGPAVRNLLGVDTDASVKFGAADQISGSVRLSGGTLDLAGHDFEVNNFSAYVFSTVTNSTGTAKLTVGIGNTDGCLIGAIAPSIALEKQGAGSFTLAAVPATSAPSSVDVADGTLVLGEAPSFLRLTIIKTRVAGEKPRLGELVLTRNGYPISYRADVTTSTSSSQVPHISAAAVDGTSSGFWLANGIEGQFVVVALKEPTVFDGYRLYNGLNVDDMASAANDPVSWRLEASCDNANWLQIDVVEDAALYTASPGVKIYDRALDPAAWTSVPFDAATPVSVADGATLKAAAPIFPMGTLTGAGTFDLMRNASAALGDVTAFTGSYSGAGAMVIDEDVFLNIPASVPPSAIVSMLSSTDTVTFPPAFTTVRNVATPASAVIGASGSDSWFAGRLLEDGAPLGLTKAGAGKTTLVDAGSTYSGDTAIKAGTLSVNANIHKFRYIRFNPTMTQNGNIPNSGYVLAISEFQLLMNGQVVAWPAGTSASTPFANFGSGPDANAINGKFNDRWLSSVIPNPLTIDTQSGVSFDAYRFYDSGVRTADSPQRCPVTWTVEGSDDGIAWLPLDAQSNVIVPGGRDKDYTPGELVGTFALSSSPRAWLPAQFRVEAPATNQFLAAVTASKFCFQVLAVRNETTTDNFGCTGYSITELTLLRDNEVVPWPAGSTAWSPVPGINSSYGNPANLINNNETATRNNRFLSSTILNHVVITTPTNLIFDAYRWITAEGQPTRDPTHWRLMVNSGAANAPFHLVDEQVNYLPSSDRGVIAGTFPIRQHAGLSGVDAIPDTSRVRIAQGATLELGAGAIETIGPLSGTGTVSLVDSATLGINLFEDAVFDGTISGHGTLALAGDHGQFFTSTNTIAGDFAVDFQGGKFGGTLHVGDALTVTGDVRYALPEGADLPYHRTLFTYDSIDPDSRAALIAGASSVTVPTGMGAKVKVTDTCAVLSISSPGMIILLR